MENYRNFYKELNEIKTVLGKEKISKEIAIEMLETIQEIERYFIFSQERRDYYIKLIPRLYNIILTQFDKKELFNYIL